MSNYPAGAKDDPRAPYDEPLLLEEDFNVSVCCDIGVTAEVPEGTTDFSEVEDRIKKDVSNLLEKQNFVVYEVIITHE